MPSCCLGRRGPHVVSARQPLRRQVRQRLPGESDAATRQHDVPEMTTVHLSITEPPGGVRAVALVLHGGREVSSAPTRSTQLAVLRMVPIARALAKAGR